MNKEILLAFPAQIKNANVFTPYHGLMFVASGHVL